MIREPLQQGALYIVISALAFACMSAAIKFAYAAGVNTQAIVFFRNSFGLLFLSPLFLRRGVSLKTNHPWKHIARSLAGLTAMYGFFFALGKLPLADSVLLSYSAPIFIPLFSWFLLGEKTPRITYLAITTGFIGMAFVLGPSGDYANIGAIVAVLASIFAALAFTIIRKISNTEPALRIVFYFALISTIVSALPMGLSWQPISLMGWLALIAAGGFASLGQYCITHGYGLAPASQIAPFAYSVVIFGAALGWLFWDETMTWQKALGAVIVSIACIMASRANRSPKVL